MLDNQKEPDKPASSTRLYSRARMKRRANLNALNNRLGSSFSFNEIKNDEVENEKVSDSHGANSVTEVRIKKSRKRHNSNSENIKPEDAAELAVSKNTSSSRETLLTTQAIKFPAFDVQNETSMWEKLSSNSLDSDPPSAAMSGIIADLKNQANVMNERHKFKILATLLPDEILRDPIGTEPRFFETALLFPDVSGFTHLCQKYDKTGKGGPSRLTEVLNGYLGSMIQVVLSRNGDVFKFGGDAFLCSWKVTDDTDITKVVHLAIESAVDIQKNCGEHKTDVGVKLRVKIAVAAGKVVFSIIGSKNKRHYVIVGAPILDVRDAEELCKPGDVIVTPSAWKYVKNYMIYSFTYHPDNKHIKVHDFGPLWKSYKSKDPHFAISRPFLKQAYPIHVESLREFILPPVMKSIDSNRSLDYLTEMRQVAIVFFNVNVNFHMMSEIELLELSNKTFQIISEIVDKAGGGTNKLTLFDKKMAILTVFGLKGFKHKLASQVALKCAYTCLEQLKKLKVLSASAGVTTGMAYCGVIGHNMRKEYTVMGHAVNMAARLMCAYQDIVSSDRSTFLNSKLESGHFEVLENEYLKGIQNAGPFYKFKLRPKKAKLKLDYETHPILGRKKEIEIFQNFLEKGMKPDSSINFFIIFGDARIGKSRLVAKLVNITQNTKLSSDMNKNDRKPIEVFLIPLTEDDSKVSYSTIRLIFQPLLGLGDSSTVEEREDKILSKLGETKECYHMASFNAIFKVNFDLTPQYLALDNEQQRNVRMAWMQDLYSKCFPKGEKWLIVIEDAEYVDEESWQFLEWCSVRSQKALYLLTISQEKALSTTASKCLENMKAFRVTLKEIDKWFYSGLACQILGVRAIPVELENLLQRYKSSGNPGWLESFLLSLIQSRCIRIIQVSIQKLKTLGLVVPPAFMLTNRVEENEEYLYTSWIDTLETFETENNESANKIPVCVIGSNFRIGKENESELTMDVMFIKTVDSLKPLQQLILKAGSVLGNNFKRNALKFLITKEMNIDERQLARGIAHLFDIKIITCAKGNLSETNTLVPRRMILVSSIRKEVTCECQGVIVPDACKGFPKYANCGFMQFRFPTFRDTLYNLLLDDQKKKFHNSCIEFIRGNTYKCKSCNSVRFNNIIGYENDNELILTCTKTPMHGIRSARLEPKSALPVSLKGDSLAYGRHPRLNSGSISEDVGLVAVTNLGDCQCSQILSSVYEVVLEHAAGARRKDIMLEVQLELASVSMTTYNIPQTMQILEEALALVNQMTEDKEYPEFCTPYIYAKIYTLMGATKLSMGRLNESLSLLNTSLKHLKKASPQNKALVKLLIQKELVLLRMTIECCPNKLMGRAPEEKAHYTDLLSECLGLISNVYKYMRNWKMARFASLWSLNQALQSNRNFYGLCTAYKNLIEIAYHCKDLETCSKLESCAIKVCSKCSFSIIELYEWEAVGHLYKVIFLTRHVRAEIEEAVLLGFQSIKIASAIRSANLKLDLMPDLIYALIQMNRLSEAVTLLQELEFISRLDSDQSSRLWFYAICLDFQLYTGYTIKTFEVCENFVKAEEDMSLVRDPFSKHKLFTSMWLWCVRNNERERVKSYGKALRTLEGISDRQTPSVVFTRLERLEGFLINLVHKMDARNIHSINAIFSDVQKLMSILEKDMKFVKLFKPRYTLLKTYYRQIRYRDDNFNKMLNQAQIQAEKMKDINTMQWIKHLKMAWNNAISPIQRDYWNEHCRTNVIEWHESEYMKNPNVMYSLPLPKF